MQRRRAADAKLKTEAGRKSRLIWAGFFVTSQSAEVRYNLASSVEFEESGCHFLSSPANPAGLGAEGR